MNIEELKEYHIPEKVTGLEELAKLGIPVPSIREYIPETGDITDNLYRNLAGKPLIVRSAHPMEDRFASGVFQSVFLDPTCDSELLAALRRIRNRIVSSAQPETNLLVARDIMHRGISNFKAEEMGIFINEYYYGYHLTIVPLEGDKYAICYFDNECKPQSTIIDLETTSFPVRLLLDWRRTVKLGESFRDYLKQIHNSFSARQEMEVVMGDHNCTWVQTKSVPARVLSTAQVSIPDNAITRALARPPYGRVGDLGSRLVALQAMPKDRLLSAPALIINEAGWLRNDTRVGNSFPPNVIGLWQDFFSTLGDTDYRHSQRPPYSTAADILLEKYAELRKLALNYRNYILVIIHQGDIHGQAEFAKKVRKTRAELAACATGQIRGFSDFYTGIENANEHALFGTVGPQQLVLVHEGILVHDEDRYNVGERKRLAALTNGTNVQIIAKADGFGAIVL